VMAGSTRLELTRFNSGLRTGVPVPPADPRLFSPRRVTVRRFMRGELSMTERGAASQPPQPQPLSMSSRQSELPSLPPIRAPVATFELMIEKPARIVDKETGDDITGARPCCLVQRVVVWIGGRSG
jgi:hypothetical protein